MHRRSLLASLVVATSAGCLELEENDGTTAATTRATATTRRADPRTTSSTSTDRTTSDATTETEAETETEQREFTEPAWTLDPDVAFERPPVAVDGTLYAATRDGRMYALDPGTGDTEWTADVGRGAEGLGRPTVAGDHLVFSSEYATAVVDTRSGDRAWGMETGSTPAVADGVLYLAGVGEYGGRSIAAAYDVATGDRLWSHETSTYYARARSTAVAGDAFVVGKDPAIVQGLDVDTGEVKWEREPPRDDVELTSIGSDGDRAFTAYENATRGGTGPLVALDPADGSVAWSTFGDQETLSTSGSAQPKFHVHDGVLYVSHTGLHAVNPENGFTQWFNGELTPSTVTPARGSLYAGARVHDRVVLLELDPSSGRVTRRVNAEYEDAWSRRPAIAGDLAVVVESTSDGNRLAAYDLTD